MAKFRFSAYVQKQASRAQPVDLLEHVSVDDAEAAAFEAYDSNKFGSLSEYAYFVEEFETDGRGRRIRGRMKEAGAILEGGGFEFSDWSDWYDYNPTTLRRQSTPKARRV